jgi:uncharacterized protein (DUF952 family)
VGDDDVLHIASPAEWDAARAAREIRPASLGSEGFVHCSTRAQLSITLARHFRGAGELVLLVLDTAALGDALRWDESRPGETFPHVYAPIPVGAVAAVERVTAPGT